MFIAALRREDERYRNSYYYELLAVSTSTLMNALNLDSDLADLFII